MVRVTRSTVIDAPIAEVWRVLRDFNGHDRWHPAVARSQVEDGRHTDQIGAIRNFRLTGGEQVRERLLSLSDRDHSLRYTIVDADLPLQDYVAEIRLKPVTDGDATFWQWRSTFTVPAGRADELSRLVAEGVYEAGFASVRDRIARRRLGLRSPAGAALAVRRHERAAGGGAGPAPVATPAGTAIAATSMVIDQYGGPERLHPATVQVPPPAPGQVRIRQTAVGVNYIDVYCRTGYFPLIEPPGAPGMEAAGLVIDVGRGVDHLRPGQRVAYACPPVGAYTTVRTVDAALVVALPPFIDDVTAAAGLLKGMTAEFLLHRVHRLRRGETALVYAPAGGVGRILCQWARHLGATVIGATSSEAKARAARAAGAHHVITPGPQPLEERVRELTDGRGADVIYDAVGRDSFPHSIAALASCGHLVSYGQASGDIGTWDIGSLAAGSVTLSRPNFVHYTDTPEKVAAITSRLFDAIERRIVTVEAGRRFALRDAASAHRALEGRQTMGACVLIPEPEGDSQ
ncbi:MAG: SRPBCC family protein [Burkholderiales bacterium]|nr:MAG: SRPBCC family protein [Burkholderiales bacterium]